jgi:hypothetical protein
VMACSEDWLVRKPVSARGAHFTFERGGQPVSRFCLEKDHDPRAHTGRLLGPLLVKATFIPLGWLV